MRLLASAATNEKLLLLTIDDLFFRRQQLQQVRAQLRYSNQRLRLSPR